MYFLFSLLKVSFLLFLIQKTIYSNNDSVQEFFNFDEDKNIIEYQEKDGEETVFDREDERIHDKIQDYQNDHSISRNKYNRGGGGEQAPLQILLKEKGEMNKNQDFKIHSIIGDYVDPGLLNRSVKNSETPLSLSSNDIRLEKGNDLDYYDVVIKKKPYVNSVLLTNYYWNQSKGRVKEYALRSLQFHPVNGNEKRLYKKMFIGKNQGLYFLIDSTPERDVQFGLAFRIRIPKYIVYGYRKGKEIYGVLRIKDGIRFNIRTFKRKYADYEGSYEDNPIILILNSRPLYIQDRPKITKIKEVLSEEYIGVYIEYESKQDFFKHFLVREENEKSYRQVQFSNDKKQDQNATLLEAYYRDGIGRILKAVIYFKRMHVPKVFYISASNMNNLQTVGQIKVDVPAYYYDSNLLQNSTDYKNVWIDGDKVDF